MTVKDKSQQQMCSEIIKEEKIGTMMMMIGSKKSQSKNHTTIKSAAERSVTKSLLTSSSCMQIIFKNLPGSLEQAV